MAKISVIVSAVNNKKDLAKTLSSLLNQSLKDIEIICICEDSNYIDSLDSSIKSNSKIKFVYQNNRELAAVFNKTINGIKSKYLMFINSSEILKPHAAKILYNQITKEKNDLIVFNDNSCKNDFTIPNCKRICAYWSTIQPFKFKDERFCLCCTKGGIYSKDFLNKNKIRFNKNQKEHAFLLNSLFYAKSISTVDNIFENKIIKKKKDEIVCAEKEEKLIQKILNSKYKKNYSKVLSRLKNKKKLRVLFLVNENSKWKAQSLYDAMETSEKFEPFVVITISDIQVNYSKKQKIQALKENYKFFKNKGLNCFYGFDFEKGAAIDLKEFKPDIVFYEQPYNLDWLQDTMNVSNYALTCYFPYYIATYKNLSLDCGRFFHSGLFRFYVLNKEFKKEYSSYMKNKGKNLKVIGHPMLDNMVKKDKLSDKNYVIYAPHWAIDHPKNPNDIRTATFLEYGETILNFALKHPEINWAFKPHPSLKSKLESIWGSKEKVENYYKQWEKIAYCCYDSNYLKLFNDSKVMITDCGSFLIEYFCLGKPVIHVISPKTSLKPYEYDKKIINTLYRVNNLKDLNSHLKRVVLENKDSKKEIRDKLLDEYGFNNNQASKKIIKDILNSINKN